MAMRVLGIGPVGTLIASGVLEEGGQVVLADFEDRTGDSALATTFTEAFRVDLSQSRAIRLMTVADLRGTLQRMQRDPRTHLTPDVAREVAVREGLKAVVTGEINAAAGGFVLSAELLEPENGNVIVAFRENARDSTQVIAAIDRLSKELRKRAGESLKAVRAAPPLYRATTTSLPALRKYSMAERANAGGDELAAVGLLRQAVALDTTFAEGYRRLAIRLGNLGLQPSERLRAMTRAYQYRDRLPEAERYRMIGSYLSEVVGDDRGALEAYQRVIEIDSTDEIALNNSGVALDGLREYGRGAAFFERACAMHPLSALCHQNLVAAQFDRGALDSARVALEAFRALLPDHPIRWRVEAAWAWGTGLFDSSEAISRTMLKRFQDPVSTRYALLNLVLLAALRGEPRRVDEYGEADVELLERLSLRREALRDRARLARLRLVLGAAPRQQVDRLEEALHRYPVEGMDPLDPPYLELAAAYLRAGRLDLAREWIADYERQVPAQWREGRTGSGLEYLRAKGELATAGGQFADAVRRFREAGKGSCQICALPGLARAYDGAGAPDSARAVYERYVTTLSSSHWPMDGAELPAALKRLGELYEAAGNRQQAVEYYARFAELWKNADPELQPVVRDVRERIARLAVEK